MTLSVSTGVFAAPSQDIKVSIDGETVSFDDAEPIIKDGTTYIPFTSVFEALGAEVSYEPSTKTVTAVKDDTRVIFKVGATQATVIKGDKTEEVSISTPAFIEGSRTYVSARFVAEALGYSIGFDDETKTVIIVDLDKVLSPYADKFTVMDKYLAYSKQFAEKPYAITGSFTVDMTLGAGEEAMPMNMTGTIDALTDAKSLDMSIAMKMDLTSLMAAVTEAEKEDPAMKEMTDMLSNMKFNYIFNMETGKYYLQSPIFDMVLGTGENSWVELDFNEFFEDLNIGMSFADLMKVSSADSFFSSVKDIVKLFPITGEEDIASIQAMVKMMADMYGDDAFVKEGNKYVSNYTHSENGSEMNMSFTFDTNKNDEVVGYGMKMSIKLGTVEFMSMEMTQDASNAVRAKINMSMPDLFEMAMNMKMQMTKSVVHPKGEPAEGSTIVSANELLNGAIAENTAAAEATPEAEVSVEEEADADAAAEPETEAPAEVPAE